MVNNQFYDSLDWWKANDHMIVFLREESKIKIDYIQKSFPVLQNKKILDLGCGAGFISVPLAKMGAKVTALDLSAESLKILEKKAKEENIENNIQTLKVDVLETLNLPEKYDLILALDVLEHVSQPNKIIINAAKNLKQDGLFIYHTLNKSFWCWFLYLQIIPRLIKYDPKDVHVHQFNIKPQQMKTWLEEYNFQFIEQIGIHAPFFQKAVWELLTQRKLLSRLDFEYTSNLSLGYLGKAKLN